MQMKIYCIQLRYEIYNCIQHVTTILKQLDNRSQSENYDQLLILSVFFLFVLRMTIEGSQLGQTQVPSDF